MTINQTNTQEYTRASTMQNPELAQSYLATGILFVRDQKILLLHRTHTGYLDDHYAIIGGKVDAGESIITNAIREAHEEVGVTIAPENIQLVHVVHRIDQHPINWVIFFFLATEWQGELYNKEPHKHSHMQWFELKHLPDNLVPTHRMMLQAWSEGKSSSVFDNRADQK